MQVRALPAPLSLLWTVLAVPLCIVAALITVGVVMSYPPNSDFPTFLRAAAQVAAGESPYGYGYALTYIYPAWFPLLMAPLTWLPVELAMMVWYPLLALALGAALWPLVATQTVEGRLAALLIGAFGFHSVWAGHPHALIICMLVYALPTRWGPVAVGVAASLKIFPIVLAVKYAGAGEWRKVAVSVAVAVGLWLPTLLIGVPTLDFEPAYTLSLFSNSEVAWAVVALVCVVAAYRLSRTRYGWLAAAVAWSAVMTRMLQYDVTNLLVSVPQQREVDDRLRHQRVVDHPVPLRG